MRVKYEVHKLCQSYILTWCYQRQLSSLVLCLCDVFQAPVNSLVCWSIAVTFYPTLSVWPRRLTLSRYLTWPDLWTVPGHRRSTSTPCMTPACSLSWKRWVFLIGSGLPLPQTCGWRCTRTRRVNTGSAFSTSGRWVAAVLLCFALFLGGVVPVFTHSFLWKGEEPPVCIGCDELLTIKRILLTCSYLIEIRQSHFTAQ